LGQIGVMRSPAKQSVRQIMQSSMQVDHCATWEEVCEALAFSPLDDYEQGSGCGICCELTPDSLGGVRVVAEELAWLALAKEALDLSCN
jgi:hypothetical protein